MDGYACKYCTSWETPVMFVDIGMPHDATRISTQPRSPNNTLHNASLRGVSTTILSNMCLFNLPSDNSGRVHM